LQKPLRIVLERRPHTAAILDGRLPAPRGLPIEIVEIRPVNRAFRRMVRDLEFDICEMAVVTHFLARAHGCPIAAIPVFVARHFPHAAIECREGGGLMMPKDLAGARIGGRSFTMTTAVWARGVLARQFGVDLDKVTWIVSDIEHVPELSMPGNVERLADADLRAMLRDGGLEAGIGLGLRDESVRPLWQDIPAVERQWLATAGAVPINHTVVIREELLRDTSELAGEIYDWFVEAQRLGESPPPDAAGVTSHAYGLTAENRICLELLLELTREQLPGEQGLPSSVDEAFLNPGNLGNLSAR